MLDRQQQQQQQHHRNSVDGRQNRLLRVSTDDDLYSSNEYVQFVGQQQQQQQQHHHHHQRQTLNGPAAMAMMMTPSCSSSSYGGFTDPVDFSQQHRPPPPKYRFGTLGPKSGSASSALHHNCFHTLQRPQMLRNHDRHFPDHLLQPTPPSPRQLLYGRTSSLDGNAAHLIRATSSVAADRGKPPPPPPQQQLNFSGTTSSSSSALRATKRFLRKLYDSATLTGSSGALQNGGTASKTQPNHRTPLLLPPNTASVDNIATLLRNPNAAKKKRALGMSMRNLHQFDATPLHPSSLPPPPPVQYPCYCTMMTPSSHVCHQPLPEQSSQIWQPRQSFSENILAPKMRGKVTPVLQQQQQQQPPDSGYAGCASDDNTERWSCSSSGPANGSSGSASETQREEPPPTAKMPHFATWDDVLIHVKGEIRAMRQRDANILADLRDVERRLADFRCAQ